MAHIEVLVQVDHRTTDGMEEPHTLQIKVDGLAASEAWNRADTAVSQFLKAELETQSEVDRQIQAAEGPWCNHSGLIGNVGYLCNLPPGHRLPHHNFSTGRTWVAPSAAQREYDQVTKGDDQ
jgi:hypothetical protein